MTTTTTGRPDPAEPHDASVARLWAAGTNSADMARILDLPEHEVERIRIARKGEHRPNGEARS